MRTRRFPFTAASLVAAAALFFALCRLTPYYADDYSYMFNFVTKERISSLGDIVQSMGIHYLKVNGRIPIHALDHVFLWMDKGVFDVIHTLSFLLLGWLTYRLSAGNGKDRLWIWPVSLALLFLLTPDFGQSFLWITGSANYLFGILPVLAYLIFCTVPGKTRRWYIAPLAFLFGVIAGWTNENTGAALCFGAAVCLLRDHLRERRVLPHRIAGLAGCICGLGMLLLAPGEHVRLDSSGGTGTIAALILRAGKISLDYFRFLGIPLMATAVLVVLCHRRMTDEKERREALFLPALLTVLSLVSAFSMAAAPYFPARTWSGPTVFIIAALMSALRAAADKGLFDIDRIWKTGAAVVLCIAVAVACFFAFGTVSDLHDQYKARDELARRQLMLYSSQSLELPAISSDSRYSCFDVSPDLTGDPDNWLNVAMARYYGAKAVIAHPSEVASQ